MSHVRYPSSRYPSFGCPVYKTGICPLHCIQFRSTIKMEVSKTQLSSWTRYLKWNCAKLRYFVHGLALRKKNEITIKGNISSIEELETVPEVPLAYPNCDLYIWLRSCDEETINPLEGIITGEIPTWIKGSLYRNGPGKQRYEKQNVRHLFDAAGLLHK